MTPTKTVKEEVKELAEYLPDDATWEDVAYAVYVRESIDLGLRDLEEGRIYSNGEAREQLNLR